VIAKFVGVAVIDELPPAATSITSPPTPLALPPRESIFPPNVNDPPIAVAQICPPAPAVPVALLVRAPTLMFPEPVLPTKAARVIVPGVVLLLPVVRFTSGKLILPP